MNEEAETFHDKFVAEKRLRAETRRWRKYLQLYALRLLPLEERFDYMSNYDLEVYDAGKVLEKSGRAPTYTRIYQTLKAIGRKTTLSLTKHRHRRLQVAGIVPIRRCTYIPDFQEQKAVYAQAIDLLARWVESYPEDEKCAETLQVIPAAELNSPSLTPIIPDRWKKLGKPIRER